MTTFWQDIRYGLRMLAKNPGFTGVAVLTLALGIGANTAIFSVVEATLLTPVSIPEPNRVVLVWTDNPARGWHNLPASVPDYLDWKQIGVFSELAAFNDGGFNLRIGDDTERLQALFVTSEMFGALQARLQLGRAFLEGEMRPGHDAVVILTDGLWRSRFGADPNVIGKSVILDGTPHAVVGVLAKGFATFEKEKIYAPLVFPANVATDRGTRSFGVLGRLRSGVTLAAAKQRMAEVGSALAKQYDVDAGSTVRLQPIAEAYVEDVRTLLLILTGVVGFVLLIGCANIANLLLARSITRGKEMATRAALGASRWALARQLVTESVLLALLGGVLGIAPAIWGIDFIRSFGLDLPHADLIKLNSTVLVFNLLLSLATGVLFGLAPAWQAWKTDLNDALKSAGTFQHSHPSRQRLRGLFVISQVAFTLVLLVGAGLMLESVIRLRKANPGFASGGVLSMNVALSDRQYPAAEKQAAFFDEVLRRVEALPGVESAGGSNGLPTGDELHGTGLFFPGRPEPQHKDVPVVLLNSVTPDYFRAMRIPLRRGRYLDQSDRKDAPLTVVVDEWTARRYWPGEDPLGKQIKLGSKEPPRQIVGVVASVQQNIVVRLTQGQVGQVYLPFAQVPKPAMSLAVRVTGEPTALAPAVRKIVRDIDPDQLIFEVQSLDTARSSSMAPQRLATLLLGGFAVVALLLATLGTYGVVAYSIGQRTREIGIRRALGAQASDVLRMVLRQGLGLTLIGVATGLVVALALTRFLASLLYDVTATDPVAFSAVVALLAGTSVLASYVPARRALRVDPTVALRYE